MENARMRARALRTAAVALMLVGAAMLVAGRDAATAFAAIAVGVAVTVLLEAGGFGHGGPVR